MPDNPNDAGAYGTQTWEFGASGSGRPTAHDVASRLLAFNHARIVAFASFELPFSESAWELLLALFVAQERGRRLTVQKLCDEATCPNVVAVRWLRALRANGLVHYNEHDGPTGQTRLTSAAENLLRGLIEV